MGIETIRQALSALRANWVRSMLTLMIIAFGIMAVIGMITAINSAIYSLNDNFTTLGANSIEIRAKNANLRGRRNGRSQKRADPITYQQALAFDELYSRTGIVAFEMQISGRGIVSGNGKETNPIVDVVGADEDYVRVKTFDIAEGRSFSSIEVERGSMVAVIGKDIVKTLFDGKKERAIGKTVSVGPLRLEVIGVFESKGQSQSDGADKMILMPIQTGRRAYGTTKTQYYVYIALPTAADIDQAVSAATGAMRVARQLKATEDNDFEIVTSDSLIEDLRENTFMLQVGAMAIGAMTLFGAAIGLMNIMLVSVTERTREIGIAKALGASRSSIMYQFLTEAMVITQVGGVFGIIIGIFVGNLLILITGGSFVVPWNWVIGSFFVCLLTGLFSGLYPAYKASRLDPIESLRYE